MQRKRGFIYFGIAILLAGFILFTSTNPESAHSEAGGRIIGWINAVFFGNGLTQAEQTAIVGAGAKLFGHFSLFLLDGLFFYLGFKETALRKRTSIAFLLLIGVVLSCFGEVIQIFADQRTPAFADVLIDYSGYLLPLLFATFKNAE